MDEESGQTTGNRRIQWIGGLIVVMGAVSGGVIVALHQQQERTSPAAVVVAVVDRGAVTVDVATTGAVEPATTRSLAFAVGGTVESVTVRPGNKVTKGQKLASLDDTNAADDADDAATDLAEARDRLASAETVAARTTASATTCARPAWASVAATCATRGYPDSGSDPVLTAEQQVYRAARAVEVARTALDGTSIVAPIAGTVLAVQGSVGDQVKSGSVFVRLADTYTMQVRAEFPEADAGSLAVGQDATITLADAGAPLNAKVVQVDPAGTSDGTLVRYGVVVSFADSPSDLLVGQSAQVRVRTGEVADVLRVPSTAVHDVSGGAGTVLVRSANRSVERTVAVGLRGDQYTEISDGLSEGDQVVRSW